MKPWCKSETGYSDTMRVTWLRAWVCSRPTFSRLKWIALRCCECFVCHRGKTLTETSVFQVVAIDRACSWIVGLPERMQMVYSDIKHEHCVSNGTTQRWGRAFEVKDFQEIWAWVTIPTNSKNCCDSQNHQSELQIKQKIRNDINFCGYRLASATPVTTLLNARGKKGNRGLQCYKCAPVPCLTLTILPL